MSLFSAMEKKITLCTVCMNRMTYLMQTLPVNLAENAENPNVEFLVLDYNSRDDMETWIKDHLSGYIGLGLLKYYKTYEPEFFHLAHSKNLIMKLATGDIIGMVDADNYTGPGYVEWVQERFAANGDHTVTTTLRKDSIPYRDQGGKICLRKEFFHAVKGFDEALIGYGMDDVDLVNRLDVAGCKRVFIEEEKHLQFISHSDEERMINYRYPSNLTSIYHCVSDKDNHKARFFYLFLDNRFSEMTYEFNEELQNNLVITYVGWTIKRHGQREGRYKWEGNRLVFIFDKEVEISAYKQSSGFLHPEDVLRGGSWRHISRDEGLYSLAKLGYCECLNRLKLIENEKALEAVNTSGWGKGTVYMNFDHSSPIRVV